MICNLCIGIERVTKSGPWPSSPGVKYTYPHHKTYVELQRSGEAGCEVCRFFLHELLSSTSLQQTSLPSGALSVRWCLSSPGAGPHILVGIENSKASVVFEPFLLPRTTRSCQSASTRTMYIPGRYFSHDPSSHCSFAWIEKFLHDCCSSTSSHLRCPKQSSLKSTLPKRVLDLEAFSEDGDLRLQTNENNNLLGKYIALSHCWGRGPKPLETTSKTLSSHLNRIKFDDLPQSFQDAVRICRRLAVPYLWLDTLCILQDSKEDWAQEASKMASIYENAYLTLAFSGAQNSQQPILSERLPVPSVRLGGKLSHIHLRSEEDKNLKRSWKSHKLPFFSRYHRHFHYATQDFAPLGHRAWAYQESLLSPRVLYFTSCQLAWKCRDGAFVESTVRPQTEINVGAYGRAELWSIPDQSKDRIADWQDFVGDFSGLSLTVASDKLVAFSGIAKRFATLLHDEYMAGLWESSLPSLLLWKARGFERDVYSRPSVYRAPSWSWAAIDGYVDHPADDGYVALVGSYFRDMRVNEVSVESATSDIFGAIKSARLSVHGFCVEVIKLLGDADCLVFPQSPKGAPESTRKAKCYVDVVSEFGPGSLYPPEIKFTYLQVKGWEDCQGWCLQPGATFGLMMKEIEKDSGIFRRVGVISITDEIDDREEWVERDLVLI